MSWDAYPKSLITGGNVSASAIVGIPDQPSGAYGCWADVGVWTKGQNAKEMKIIGESFSNPEPIRAGGLFINGVRYTVISVEPELIRAKISSTQPNGPPPGKEPPVGVVIARTKKTFVVGLFTAGVQPGNASLAVEKQADYLKNSNY